MEAVLTRIENIIKKIEKRKAEHQKKVDGSSDRTVTGIYSGRLQEAGFVLPELESLKKLVEKISSKNNSQQKPHFK